MSVLVRFEHDGVKYKTRLYERASRKQVCECCGNRRDGVLLRRIDPEKKDVGICTECIVLMSYGIQITTPDPKKLFGLHPKKPHIAGRKRGPKAKSGPKVGSKNKPKPIKITPNSATPVRLETDNA